MSDKIEDGGQAFPFDPLGNQSGMSMRDYFAAAALQGMAGAAGFQSAPWDKLSKNAYEAADAMLAARRQP